MGYQARTKFDWVIEDFRWRPEKVGKVISLGTFSVSGPADQVTEWCLQIYPKGRREDTKDHVAVYLKSKNSVPVRASFTLYVMSGEKRKDCISRVCEEVCTFQPMDSDKETRWGNREFIHEDRFEVPDFLTAEGALNVVCELTVFGREKTLTGLKIHNSSGMRQVGEDFWNTFCGLQVDRCGHPLRR